MMVHERDVCLGGGPSPSAGMDAAALTGEADRATSPAAERGHTVFEQQLTAYVYLCSCFKVLTLAGEQKRDIGL